MVTKLIIHTYIHTYIYIYILNNSPYGKKNSKCFEDENIQRITVKGKKIYIGKKKKEKANLVIPIEKKSKGMQLVAQKKKPPSGLLSYNPELGLGIHVFGLHQKRKTGWK